MTTPHVGLRTGDMEELYGAVKFRVLHVFNGQPASRVVFETGRSGTYAGVTLVDGVVTEFEDLGPMPDDASFRGRSWSYAISHMKSDDSQTYGG